MSNDYLHTAARLRHDGWQVCFRNGRVLVRSLLDSALASATAIDGGRWMDRPMTDWDEVTDLERRALDVRARSCYCSSLPGTGCDFCNGVRVAPGVAPDKEQSW